MPDPITATDAAATDRSRLPLPARGRCSRAIECDGEPAGGGAGERREHVGRRRERDQRSAADAKHPVAHQREGRHRRHHRAEATRLATLSAGSTEALAPASMVARNDGSRDQLIAITVTIAAASAVTTAHTPPTAWSDVAPQRSSARKDASRRGSTRNDITRLTSTTTTSELQAARVDGPEADQNHASMIDRLVDLPALSPRSFFDTLAAQDTSVGTHGESKE